MTFVRRVDIQTSESIYCIIRQGKSANAGQKHHIERTAAFEKYVPQQIKIDLARYEKNYYFSRHRKSTRIIMDNAIRFAQWLDKLLSKKESRIS